MQDLRYAFRSLLKSPGFTCVAVLTLALGIGANVALFNVVDRVLLRPLPYPDSSNLVSFVASDVKRGSVLEIFGVPDVMDLRMQTELFEQVAAYQKATTVLAGEQSAQPVHARRVSPEFFTVFKVNPYLGRYVGPNDAPGTVVLSNSFWRRQFGADRNILGRTMVLGNMSYEVVGVMPSGFDYPADSDMWIPLVVPPRMQARGVRTVEIIGRLNTTVTIADANAQMAMLSDRLAADHPLSHGAIETRVRPLRDAIVGAKKLPLIVLFGAVGAILLIALANVTALNSVRIAQRRREFAIRTSLGARRASIVRLIAAEGAVLASVSAAVGVLVGYWTLSAVVAFMPEGLIPADAVAFDARIAIFFLAVTTVCALCFCLLPLRELRRIRPSLNLRSDAGASDGNSKLRGVLVTVQVAVTVVLVSVAALMLNSFARLNAVDIGMDPDSVVTFAIPYSGATAAEYNRVTGAVVERLRAHPDVDAVARSSVVPLRGFQVTGAFRLEGASANLSERAADDASLNIVSSDYFRTYRLALLKGRVFGRDDRAGAPDVIIINESLARRFFNGGGIGQRISIPGRGNRHAEIVGIVRDVYQVSPTHQPRLEVYWPAEQAKENPWQFSVRTTGDPGRLLGDLPALVRSVDRRFFADRLSTAEQLVWDSVAEERFRTMVVSIYSLLAVLLAVIGVYGVIAYAVSQRQSEIGLRMALGAQAGNIYRMVLRQGFTPCIIGLLCGLVILLALVRSIESLLFEVSATDPWTLAASVALVAIAGFAACLIPARRAAGIDPLVALRYE